MRRRVRRWMAIGTAGMIVAGMALTGGAPISAETGGVSKLLQVTTPAPKRDNLDMVTMADPAPPIDVMPVDDSTPPDDAAP